jgi:hypothetical protein
LGNVTVDGMEDKSILYLVIADKPDHLPPYIPATPGFVLTGASIVINLVFDVKNILTDVFPPRGLLISSPPIVK